MEVPVRGFVDRRWSLDCYFFGRAEGAIRGFVDRRRASTAIFFRKKNTRSQDETKFRDIIPYESKSNIFSLRSFIFSGHSLIRQSLIRLNLQFLPREDSDFRNHSGKMWQCQTKSLGNLVCFKTCNHDLRNSLKLNPVFFGALDTSRGFVVLSEFEVRTRLLLSKILY